MDKQCEKLKNAQTRATINFTDSVRAFTDASVVAFERREEYPAICGIERSFAIWDASTHQIMTQASGQVVDAFSEAKIIESKKANT